MISLIFGLVVALIYASLATTVSIPVLVIVTVVAITWFIFLKFTLVLFYTLKAVSKNPKLEADLKAALQADIT